MGQLADVSLGGPFVGLAIAVVVLVVALSIRLYMIRNPGSMRAKCPKCNNVFDASRSISILHIGTLKQLKCPACGKISLMNTYVKDPLTWPPQEKKQEQTAPQLTGEELEQKRIEDSKYERT
ncbi:MAG: hypothetical protein M1167_02150 [Chloroflexi bacterium]|nr:hypothetical protein [Chloroflexota bacterium]